MKKKLVEFIIDKDLDFQNHLVGARVFSLNPNFSKETNLYFEKFKEATENEKMEIFEKKSEKFYSAKFVSTRNLLLKQIQEMWNLTEDEYFKRMEKIHQNKFPLEKIYGVLSTTPTIYGYSFNVDKPWFACKYDYPLRAVSTAMHEIMHVFFAKYFLDKYKNKFNLDDKQIHDVKEALTVILNLEFEDLRFFLDTDKPGQEELRKKVKESWLKYKNIDKVLDEACAFIKNSKS